jgi:uncharacterized membrane protein (UPF0127 family)
MIRRLALLPLLITVLLALAGCDESEPRTETVTLGGVSHVLELAVTDEQVTRGLMGRTEIPAGAGMLFVFPDMQVRRFWMKNCLVPIDVVFLDGQGWITAIHTMPPPPPGTPDEDLPFYSSRRPAQFAIELAGGMAKKLGLKSDTRLDLPLERLKRVAR